MRRMRWLLRAQYAIAQSSLCATKALRYYYKIFSQQAPCLVGGDAWKVSAYLPDCETGTNAGGVWAHGRVRMPSEGLARALVGVALTLFLSLSISLNQQLAAGVSFLAGLLR